MAKPHTTIAGWTPAQLQAFLQNQVQLDPSALPPAINANNVEAGQLNITGGLDFASNARLTKDGVPLNPLMFPGSSFDGSMEAMFVETAGTAIWRASGGTILAQVGDLPDFGDEYDCVNGRVQASMLYLPARSPINHIHCFVSTIPSAVSNKTNKVGLFHTADGVTYTEVALVSGIGSNLTNSTGFKTFNLDAPSIMDPGVLTVALFTSYNSITGNLKLACKSATRFAQNAGYLGGLPRTANLTGQTDLPTTWSSAGAAADRVWFGIS